MTRILCFLFRWQRRRGIYSPFLRRIGRALCVHGVLPPRPHSNETVRSGVIQGHYGRVHPGSKRGGLQGTIFRPRTGPWCRRATARHQLFSIWHSERELVERQGGRLRGSRDGQVIECGRHPVRSYIWCDGVASDLPFRCAAEADAGARCHGGAPAPDVAGRDQRDLEVILIIYDYEWIIPQTIFINRLLMMLIFYILRTQKMVGFYRGITPELLKVRINRMILFCYLDSHSILYCSYMYRSFRWSA